MAHRRPARSDDHRKRAADREQRLAALRVRLQETARQIRTAEDWTRCLQTAARLPGESWANVLLIASRVPAASLVKGYEAWRSAGRQVIRNQKGIEIFSGARQQAADRRDHEDGERDHNSRDANRVTYVWDLSQTGRQPVPAPAAGRRHHALGRPPHPRPPRSRRRPGHLGADPPARAHPPAQHGRRPAGYHHLRLPGNPERRSRLRRVHHLRPPRHPGRARLR
jgi:hypothetical protein